MDRQRQDADTQVLFGGIYRNLNLRFWMMLWFALGAGMPVLLSTSTSQFQHLRYVAFLLLVVLTFCYRFIALRFKKAGFYAYPLLFFLAANTGFCINALQLTHIINGQLPVSAEGGDFPVVLSLTGLPEWYREKGRESVAFIALVDEGEDFLKGKKIRLRWYQPPANELLLPGSRWAVTVRLKRPRGTVNPDGFDYQAWLLARNIAATGYVRTASSKAQPLGGRATFFSELRFRLRHSLFVGRDAKGRSDRLDGFLQALLIGDKSSLDRQAWQVLQRTGTVHLMAISGLHIGLAAAIGFWIGKALAHCLALWRHEGCHWLAMLGAVGAAFFYAGLAGFAIPTQRALVMVSLFSLAMAGYRRVNYWQVYILAMCTVVVLHPFAFITSGFWLSFVAVAVLVYVFAGRRHKTSRLRQMLTGQVWLLLGLLMPLTLLGLPTALISPVCNLIAVPVVSLLVVPLLLLAAISCMFSVVVAQWVLAYAHWIMKWLWLFLDKAATWDSLWYISHPPSLGLALTAGLATLLLLSPSALSLRALGAALLVVQLFPRGQQASELQLTVLDVQQGLSAVLSSAGYTLVYDTGAAYGSDFDMGSRVLVPFLRTQGKRQLDMLMISHGDNDHAGGTASVVDAVPVVEVLSGEPQRLPVAANHCQAGQQWQVGELSFNVLWPTEGQALQSNDNSCVLLIRFQEYTILLTGDIENSVEQSLLSSGILPRRVDVLVVPHHGSRSSSSQAFIDYIKPRYAVISAGYRNRYQHPSPETLARLQAGGAEILRTDVDGAIRFIWHAHRLQVIRQRRASPRPWYW